MIHKHIKTNILLSTLLLLLFNGCVSMPGSTSSIPYTALHRPGNESRLLSSIIIYNNGGALMPLIVEIDEDNEYKMSTGEEREFIIEPGQHNIKLKYFLGYNTIADFDVYIFRGSKFCIPFFGSDYNALVLKDQYVTDKYDDFKSYIVERKKKIEEKIKQREEQRAQQKAEEQANS